MNRTVIMSSETHTLIDDKLIKRPFNKNYVGTIKTLLNKVLTKISLLGSVE